jgi:gluconokinase
MILVVGGVSGSGKTTVGALVAGRLGWRFADADDFHPDANVAKMRAGIPLTDADRLPWLRAVAAWMDDRITDGESAVVACSMLKRSYRDLLRDDHRDSVLMVFLDVPREELERRLTSRHGHFFPERLLASQLSTSERPTPDEGVLTVSVTGNADETANRVLATVKASGHTLDA